MLRTKQRQISEGQYFRAILNNGYLTKEDQKEVFTEAERLGYGACSGQVFISSENGLPYVMYTISDNCD